MIIICIIKKLSHNTQHHLPDIVTFFSEPSPSPTKNKNLDYKILYKTFLPFFLHDSDNNRKFAADKIRKLMKEKRYPIGWHPANEEEAMARIEAIEAEYERTGVSYNEEEFFNKLNEERTWSNADDFEKELTAQDPWLEDWKRSISIEDFRKNCKNKLNKLFP